MKDGFWMQFRKRWAIEEQSFLLKRLGVLLKHGYSISESIDLLIVQRNMASYQTRTLKDIYRRLKEGESFSAILREMKFHPVAVSFIYYGEYNGELAGSMERAGLILEKRHQDWKQLRLALGYPLFLLFFTLFVMIIFHFSLVPNLGELYSGMSREIPMSLRFLLWFQDHLQDFLLLAIAIPLLIAFMLYRRFRKKSKYEVIAFFSRLPLVGYLLRLWNTYYISYQISQLLKNGHSLSECLQFVSEDPEQPFLQEAIGIVKEELLAGIPLALAVEKIEIWQREFSSVISHGQLTGNLDIELETYSQLCFDLFFEKTSSLLRKVQPILFVLIGLWILLLYLSFMLPSFQMIQYL